MQSNLCKNNNNLLNRAILCGIRNSIVVYFSQKGVIINHIHEIA